MIHENMVKRSAEQKEMLKATCDEIKENVDDIIGSVEKCMNYSVAIEFEAGDVIPKIVIRKEVVPTKALKIVRYKERIE